MSNKHRSIGQLLPPTGVTKQPVARAKITIARAKVNGALGRSKPVRKAAASKTIPRTPTGHIMNWASNLSPMQVIAESKQGIRGRDLQEIQERTIFSNADWSRFLQVAWRTIQRYRKDNAIIDSASSERALLMAQLAERGREVFGDDTKFKIWLDSPSFALGGAPPMDLLDTTTGMRMVSAELTRIEYGVY